ncbi:MAG: methionyl-tRNA formyltransferase [Flavobacteriales bacterium]|nr:methionyl-tRNA formyltransferase [Flavobacteriales bacterium]
MSTGLRIIFMGTPEFAVASLDAIVKAGHNVVAVITAPDKGVGRGQQIQESAVKTYAVQNNIPILQPTNLKDPEFLEELKSYSADVQVVVAFRMLPEIVWAMPPKGTINLHASLLPDYRGAAPINWAIINGDSETGLTTFFIEKEIDTGKVLLQERVAVPHDWSAGDLHNELMEKGGALVVKTIAAMEVDGQQAVDQSTLETTADVRLAPKIFKEDCRIDWNKPAEDVYNHIRGLSPYPAAWSELSLPDGTAHSIKIFKTRITYESAGEAGSIETDGKNEWNVACGEGSLKLKEIQLAGKKRMRVSDFLRGFELNNKGKLK